MNKKIKICVFLVLGAAVCIGGWLLFLIFGPKKGIESYLPADAAAFVRLKNPAKYWRMGVQSEFWNNIAAIDVPQLLHHNQIKLAKINQIEKLKNNMVTFFQSPITQKFLEKEIAVAFYHRPNVKNLDESYEVLLALRLPVSMRAVALTSQMWGNWSKVIQLTQESYKGKNITHVRIKENNFEFKYAVLDDILIASLENDLNLYKTIDLSARQSRSLLEDAHFKFAQSHAYEQADSLAFVDIQSFLGVFMDEGQSPVGDHMGVDTYAFSFQSGNVNKYKFALGYKPELFRNLFSKMASCRPQENNSLPLIPASAISYQWSTCYDFSDLWGKVKEKTGTENAVDGQVSQIKHAIEKRFGVDFGSDFKSILGREVGGYLTDIDTLGMFPYPRLLLFIKVSDRFKAQELISKILTNYAHLIQTEQYHGDDIHYFSLPIGGNMDPAYCFTGDYLLLSSSRQLIKKSIDTLDKPETSLGRFKNFESLNWSMKERPHSIFYVKVGDFSKRLRDIFGWVDKYLSSQAAAVVTLEQESNQRKMDLDAEISSKEDEFKQATKKLKELKMREIGMLSGDEQDMYNANVKSIESDLIGLKQDIQENRSQIKKLDQRLENAQSQARNAKVMIYNSQHVLVPLLKGLEGLNSLGISVSVKTQVLETELSVN